MPVLKPLPQRSVYDEALATVQKAVRNDRELTLDKNGNLKVLGFFRNFFLQCKINFLSDEQFMRYCQKERNPARSAVLDKLESFAKEARREAILSSCPEDKIANEREGINDFVDAFIAEKQKQYKDICAGNDFNGEALDFLKNSKNVTYARKPVAPAFHNPDHTTNAGLTFHEKSEHKHYLKSMRIYESTLASRRVLDHTDFRENPNFSAKTPQGRIQFYSKEKYARADELIDTLESTWRMSKEEKECYAAAIDRKFDSANAREAKISTGPKKTHNREDFKFNAEKRIITEIGRRKRQGQVLEEEEKHARMIGFLCFLRQQVQKEFTRKGELPEQFQAFFNENSAVSIPDSPKNPDRLIPSKKLASLAVDLCLNNPESESSVSANPEHGSKSKPLAFSDVVGVQEITSSEVNQQIHRYAAMTGIQRGTGANAVTSRRLVLSKGQQEQLFPRIPKHERDRVTPGQDEVERMLPNYVSGEAPEEHKKYHPHGEEYPTAENGADDGDLHIRPDRAGTEKTHETTGVDWVKNQYTAWSTSQLN